MQGGGDFPAPGKTGGDEREEERDDGRRDAGVLR